MYLDIRVNGNLFELQEVLKVLANADTTEERKHYEQNMLAHPSVPQPTKVDTTETVGVEEETKIDETTAVAEVKNAMEEAATTAPAEVPAVEEPTPEPEPELDRKAIRAELDAMVTLKIIEPYKKGLGTPNLAKLLEEAKATQQAPPTVQTETSSQPDQIVDAAVTEVATTTEPEASLDDFSNALAATVRKKAAELGGGEPNFHKAIAWMRETYCDKREKKDVRPEEYAMIVADMKLYTEA